MLRVLLTNDDGIHAEGLQALRRALVALDDVELAVIAPDANMSATARSITTRRPLWVTEVPFDDGTHGYSCDGTPVDCVRLASLGLVERLRARPRRRRHQPRLQPRRRHHLLGHGRRRARGDRARRPGARDLPAVAGARDGLPARRRVHFETAAAFTARVVDRLDDVPLPDGHAAQHQRARRATPRRSRSARLGKRIYRDALRLIDTEGDSRRRFRVYGDAPVHDDEEGTDLAAVAAGRIAVTPLHFDLTAEHGLEELRA